jgi:hypothetical protein
MDNIEDESSIPDDVEIIFVDEIIQNELVEWVKKEIEKLIYFSR